MAFCVSGDVDGDVEEKDVFGIDGELSQDDEQMFLGPRLGDEQARVLGGDVSMLTASSMVSIVMSGRHFRASHGLGQHRDQYGILRRDVVREGTKAVVAGTLDQMKGMTELPVLERSEVHHRKKRPKLTRWVTTGL